MILLCGIPSESPLAMAVEHLKALDARYVLFDQLRLEDAAIDWELLGGRPTGELRLNGSTYPLEEFTGVYTRLMDEQQLPQLATEPVGSARRRACRALHQALSDWYEVGDARVVNRSQAMASNGSKPYQAQLILEHGFSTPPTLITTDPTAVRDFIGQHGNVVFKSISGLRSIVQRVGEADVERLELISWCPVQFQAYIEGTNIRVHTIGDTLFATAIDTDATDYRYATWEGRAQAELTATELPSEIAQRCVELTSSLGLAFAGIDLKVTPSGEWHCFEVNPSPAYSYYEAHTGQPIAAALAGYLAG